MIKYSSEIGPTKFLNAEELATFLSGSYWWEREWTGLDYDHEECVKMLRKLREADDESKKKTGYADTTKLKETIVKPFWLKQLEKYDFPVYLKRRCVYTDGWSSDYCCEFVTEKQYLDHRNYLIGIYEAKIQEFKKYIKDLKER